MSDDWLFGGRPPGGRHAGDPSEDQAQPDETAERRSEAPADATRPVRREPGPDETRVMPTLSRSQGTAAPASSAPPAAAAAAAARPTLPPPSSTTTPPPRSTTGGDPGSET